MKQKTLKSYENDLKEMVTERKGRLDKFLLPQIRLTAQCWRLMDKIDEELAHSDLMTLTAGSMGQMKREMNPLIAQHEKTSRALRSHFAALGINFDATPSKVNETENENAKPDPLADLLSVRL